MGASLKAGIPFSLHTDAPVSPPGPLRLVQIAVTRRCEIDNSVIGADEAITVDEAMKAITVHAARQIGLEDAIGTLEPGKDADLTILEADPFKMHPDAISAIKVSETWVAGEKALVEVIGPLQGRQRRFSASRHHAVTPAPQRALRGLA